jgi:hypothetical protein
MIYDLATNTAVFAGGAIRPTAGNAHAEDRQDAWKINLATLGSPGATWQSVKNIPFGANHMSFVTAKDGAGAERHFFVGGQNGENEHTGNVDDNYEYIVASDTWTEHTPMTITRGHAASSTRATNCGYTISGGSSNQQDPGHHTADISFYSIPDQNWTKIGDLPFALNTPVCEISPTNPQTGKQYYHCVTGWVDGYFSYWQEISLS